MSGTHLTHNPKIFAFIQARLGSSRLPKKVLLPLQHDEITSYNLLEQIYLRLSRVLNPENIVYLVPFGDDELISYIEKRNWNLFVGDLDDVRNRYLQAGYSYGADVILRLTGDNPFPDISAMESIIEAWVYGYQHNFQPDLVYASPLPLGMGIESFSLKALKRSLDWNENHHREHVSLSIKENPELFHICRVSTGLESYSSIIQNLRLTIDERQDYLMMQSLTKQLLNSSSFRLSNSSSTRSSINLSPNFNSDSSPKYSSYPNSTSNLQSTSSLESGLESDNEPHIGRGKKSTEWTVEDFCSIYQSHPNLFHQNQSVEQVRFPLPPHPPSLGKLLILVADAKIYGSGHLERMKILSAHLSAFQIGADLELIKNQEDINAIMEEKISIPNSEYKGLILDVRNLTVEKNTEIPMLYIDNFHPNRSFSPNKLSSINNIKIGKSDNPIYIDILPHPKSDHWNLESKILGSSLIDFHSQYSSNSNSMDSEKPIKKPIRKILIYSGSLDSSNVGILEDKLSSHYPEADVTRIGNSKQYKFTSLQRLSKKEWFTAIVSTDAFLSYFGQGMMEAIYLGKKVASFSISSDHHELSEYLNISMGIPYWGSIESLEVGRFQESKKMISIDISKTIIEYWIDRLS